jgi:hypothetical protein
MLYSVSFNYRKRRPSGRYPSQTVGEKRFKKQVHAIREYVRQKAKGKYVEMGVILPGSVVLDFMMQ